MDEWLEGFEGPGVYLVHFVVVVRGGCEDEGVCGEVGMIRLVRWIEVVDGYVYQYADCGDECSISYGTVEG